MSVLLTAPHCALLTLVLSFQGFQSLHNLEKLPTESQMQSFAEQWKPFRSVGSYYMWKVDNVKKSKRSKQNGNGNVPM